MTATWAGGLAACAKAPVETDSVSARTAPATTPRVELRRSCVEVNVHMFDPPVEVLCRGGWIARGACDVIADTKLSIATVPEIATRQGRSEAMLPEHQH